MFSHAPSTALTVKVGSGDSMAKWNAENPQAIRDFLRVVVDQNFDNIAEEKVPIFQSDLDEARSAGYHTCREQPFASCREFPEGPSSQSLGEDEFPDLLEEET
eukprot:gnl/MRDRNA2_/MRDRNA2_76826_c0_seq1.p1 gnl/MRDRNA2_/MRDRNA2_76826_c0~~gnl/MRDRNA2_/MRDRNA2_76826_c0_seq1.p1  ORF type:complete len:103 (-),score=18.93 gnl/MRDRNA2_/MRDRNA2_76826_c0_seq1:146-454(-)